MRFFKSAVTGTAVLCLMTSACVMPQHRAMATVVNTALVGFGTAGQISIANEPADSWHLFDDQLKGITAAMIALGLLGELITLGAHEDEHAPRPAAAYLAPRRPKPALDCATVIAVLDRSSETERARLTLEPRIAVCLATPGE